MLYLYFVTQLVIKETSKFLAKKPHLAKQKKCQMNQLVNVIFLSFTAKMIFLNHLSPLISHVA